MRAIKPMPHRRRIYDLRLDGGYLHSNKERYRCLYTRHLISVIACVHTAYGREENELGRQEIRCF